MQENISLKKLTTFKIGGEARYFFIVKNTEELKEAVIFSQTKKLPLFILGGGSNVLVSDEGFSGLVVKMEIKGIEELNSENQKIVIAGAGENWDSFVKYTVEKNLVGLENLSGIPGTVGASPVQNIGAYGAEVGNSISWVEVWDIESNEIKILKKGECEFGYRESIFKKRKNLIITRVAFEFLEDTKISAEYKDVSEYKVKNNIKEFSQKLLRKAILEIRNSKMPDLNKFGTAGSFFKNPVVSEKKFEELKKQFPELPSFKSKNGEIKIPLAYILDKICGLKGYRKNNVELFKNQPIVIVSDSGATAKDVKNLAKEVIEIVKSKTGVEIEWEVNLI